jgi:hypothetical protein
VQGLETQDRRPLGVTHTDKKDLLVQRKRDKELPDPAAHPTHPDPAERLIQQKLPCITEGLEVLSLTKNLELLQPIAEDKGFPSLSEGLEMFSLTGGKEVCNLIKDLELLHSIAEDKDLPSLAEDLEVLSLAGGKELSNVIKDLELLPPTAEEQ